MRVAVVSTERGLRKVHQAIVAGYEEAQRCSPHQPPYPDLAALAKVLDPEVEIWTLYAVSDKRRILLAAMVEHTIGRISWLCHCIPVAEAVEKGAVPALCERIRSDCGACWGHVENPEVRAALLGVYGGSPPGEAQDGPRIEWVPRA